MIRVRQRCKECANITSDSQTLVGNIPLNLMMSAGILFAGSNPSKTLRVFTNMYCPAITKRTFHRHQRNWLHPTISRVWRESQEEMIEGLKEIGMAVNHGGDGRSDSPGHSAKYGSYTFVDLDWNMVLHQELVQDDSSEEEEMEQSPTTNQDEQPSENRDEVILTFLQDWTVEEIAAQLLRRNPGAYQDIITRQANDDVSASLQAEEAPSWCVLWELP
ncbi:hypothetical protein BSL78_28512 [Apostichopus japonicus]|uniref:Uncharacterized protein n=1 Tax=Stichopus japonicus TaxID=307972 RepID=A0A2G8JG02_STIJA|nr:hypothetical protein BSL78_28512 [Apostichopus japonicus]